MRRADILKIGPQLIETRPLLQTLIANRFPFIFVDESQDTSPEFVMALRKIDASAGPGFCLGFFGDPMQKIYTAGVGPIAVPTGWNEITKPENFRCPTSVLRVVNRIRAEDDGLQQVRGRTIDRDGVAEPVVGTARLFILPSDDQRLEQLSQVRQWLSDVNDDPLWIGDESQADVRMLVLVHRMAAERLGFPNLYAALNDGAPPSLKDGLLDGTAWVLRPFMTYLLPLVLASRAGDDFEVITALRRHCPLLIPDRLAGEEPAALLGRLSATVRELVAMLDETSIATIGDVIAFVRDRELVKLDPRFIEHAATVVGAGEDDEDGSMDAAVARFLACRAVELWGYRTYVEGHSPFTTQQGVKGAEFMRVLVVLDDEESGYNLFSYGKYFGIIPLSTKDEENETKGADSVLARTRRLFYVCCSRAVEDLAVVLFVPDVTAARTAITLRGLFAADDIFGVEDLPQL